MHQHPIKEEKTQPEIQIKQPKIIINKENDELPLPLLKQKEKFVKKDKRMNFGSKEELSSTLIASPTLKHHPKPKE